MAWSRILRVLLVVYVAATALYIAYIVGHEPFSFDAWNVAFDTRSEPATLDRFLDYWWFEYTHSNPRLGQALTYLAYKLEYFAVIATPIAYFAIALAVTVLGIGRSPHRRGRDLALFAIAIGFGWFALPEIGRNMFNRAYGANYIYGAAIQLWFLVPLRLAGTYDASTPRCVLYALAGVLAGACNEHTGPAIALLLVGLAWQLRRRGERPRLVIAAAIGFVVGFCAIFFAPGQGERYDGLVTKTSLPMRMVQRGVIGMLDILHDYVAYAAPLLLLVLVLLVRSAWDDRGRPTRTLRLLVLAIAIGLAMAITLFVSPKLGSRFYTVSLALLLAATIAVIDALAGKRTLAALVVLAVAASSYAAIRTIPLYTRVARQSHARLAGLAATKPGDVFVADAFDQSDESWWFIGDDFDDANKRARVARYLGLARVSYRGFDMKQPLGTAGVAVVARYWLPGEPCPLDDRELDLEGRGFDVPGIVASTRDRIAQLRAQLAPRSFERYELAVEFPGTPPQLPASRILVARAVGDELEQYAGAITRPGASLTREIQLPPALANQPRDIYVLQVGGDYKKLGSTRGEPLRFTPWRTGIYWALACNATECFVIAAARSHAG
ncbi:MAG TPA: DUF6056 family protein [Kofleriaceae bacterium]|nr:DUF6056 family protein [Kofleriaceae bacterium]